MKIATWNINGIKARIDNLKKWLEQSQPDIVCLQEIKSLTENFPNNQLEDMGYNVIAYGQKSFNGVAILSKLPIDESYTGLPGDETDEQARYLETVISTESGALRVASIYLPNGNPVDTEKYPYKLKWMSRLKAHIHELLKLEEPLILAGDYNVIPTNDDVHDPVAWAEDALFLPQTRKAFQEIINLGLTDAFTACHSKRHLYTFWDYQRGAWQKDHGIRIDHILMSPQAADKLNHCEIERYTRGWEKPSDHVPVYIDLTN